MILHHREAKKRMCVFYVPKRGYTNFRSWIKYQFWRIFFPWVHRNILFSYMFCSAQGCHYWKWIDNERGYCAVADARAALAQRHWNQFQANPPFPDPTE